MPKWTARSLRRGRLGPLATVDLENRWLKVRVLPEVGAKIYDLIWKPTGRNILYHNPRIAPQVYPIESEFDNYWCGGWDEAPNPPISGERLGFWRRQREICGQKTSFHGICSAITV